MDLIDKKISEKLKLFEIIDKKYGTNPSQSNLPKSEIESNKRNFYIPQEEIFQNKEIYDNLYSDFKINSYKSVFYSPTINTLNSNITNYKKINKTKYSKKNDKSYKNNNLSQDGEYPEYSYIILEGKEQTNRSKSRTNEKKNKNLSKLYPPNDSGNRLYNYGYYLKNK